MRMKQITKKIKKGNNFWSFFIETFWTSKFVFGQVIIIVTCPNGQVGKKVNVEPWWGNGGKKENDP